MHKKSIEIRTAPAAKHTVSLTVPLSSSEIPDFRPS